MPRGRGPLAERRPKFEVALIQSYKKYDCGTAYLMAKAILQWPRHFLDVRVQFLSMLQLQGVLHTLVGPMVIIHKNFATLHGPGIWVTSEIKKRFQSFSNWT